ncbi:ion channel [Aestuariivirga sp.]|uniref:ion channel n=1 Tax=Aestuariivirga sp. TaxID=2650926 RepID=UPI003594328A
MILQLAVGGLVFACCVAIHASFMLWTLKVALPALRRLEEAGRLVLSMVMVVGLLAIAHVTEVSLWAFVMGLVGAIPGEGDALYFAFTSYTTLGYGDVLAVKQWQMLGPISAMNGVLLFGWSTAVIFQALQTGLRVQAD